MVNGPGREPLPLVRPEPRQRLILLGASNLARGFSTVVETARMAWPVPLDILGAIGHGRSFGQQSWVLGRGLPGIKACGLWQSRRERPELPTAALVTDIGNDLLYSVPVSRVADWVAHCLDELQPYCASVALTQLPMDTLRRMRRGQFGLMRTLFFPSSRLTYEQAIERAEQLNERLRILVRARGLQPIEPTADWYGYDPIHIRRRCFATAWQAVFAHLREHSVPQAKRVALRHWWRMHTLCPERRWWFGIEQQREQPSLYLPDGTRVSLY